MSRLSLLAWATALASAAFSTGEIWDLRQQPPAEMHGGMCPASGPAGGLPYLSRLLTPLVGDASALADLAVLYAVPAVLVVAGFLTAGSRPRAPRAGRRVAGLLTLIALASPLGAQYFDFETCQVAAVLSWRWFTEVVAAWGAAELLLLVAAALVLLVTQDDAEPAPADLGARRSAAFVIDYLIVVTLTNLAGLPASECGPLSSDALSCLLLLPVAVTYALSGRTFGKRIARIEVVSATTGGPPRWRGAAVRALVFPGLVLLPGFGVVALVVDGLWWLVDGHPLHDRLSGTTVKRAENDLLWR
ncbi:RDD family protein [Nonomuraea spiralis]|uniref:RDD family protein n=1 Tax=Nonomuraea spiralis TaxID=46182 RepID=A0ABV5ID06_9ACTN|nr:RDD family protein [Nonomuraea spiralis]GGT20565.1 hypothetical protein GCM10010176_076360 [Nonomuraea spiralis]